MKPSVPRSGTSARCPRCHNVFECGMHSQPFECWCREMPVLPAGRLDPDGRCLCPQCLAAELARGGQPGSLAGGS